MIWKTFKNKSFHNEPKLEEDEKIKEKKKVNANRILQSKQGQLQKYQLTEEKPGDWKSLYFCTDLKKQKYRSGTYTTTVGFLSCFAQINLRALIG